MKKVVILLAPLLLAILEYFHPFGFSKAVYANLEPRLTVWLTVHVLQLILFSAVGVALWWVIEGLSNWAAIIARWAIVLFVILYNAFDAVAGIGTGSLIRITSIAPSPDKISLIQQFYNDPYLGGSHSWLSETASLSALIAVWGVAFALLIGGRNKLTILCYFLAGPILWNSHAYPYGPMAFSLIFLGNLALFNYKYK